MSSQLSVSGSQEELSRLRRESERVSLNPKPQTLDPNVNPRSGFTLLELVVVVGILAILFLGVAFLLKPGQMIARASDATRVSNLDALVDALEFALAEGPSVESGGVDPDGSNTGTCANESTPMVYVSVPSSETPPTDLPSGWDYKQVLDADLQNIDGTGWLPINFTAGGGTPAIAALPIDRDNTFANGFYYSYVCDSGGSYELTARMASDERRTGGNGDLQSNDGGDDVFAYEVGGDLSLNPIAPVAAWGLNGGTSGSIANGETTGFEDSSGNTNDGNASNANGTGMQWTAGLLDGAVNFDGVDDWIDGISQPSIQTSPNVFTVTGAINPANQDTFFITPNSMGVDQDIGYQGANERLWIRITELADTNNRARYSAVGSVPNNEWTHWAVSLNDKVLTIYINGELDSQYIETIDIGGWTNNWILGQRGNNSFWYQGIMDEVQVFDRILTLEEIAYQYNSLVQ